MWFQAKDTRDDARFGARTWRIEKEIIQLARNRTLLNSGFRIALEPISYILISDLCILQTRIRQIRAKRAAAASPSTPTTCANRRARGTVKSPTPQ